MTALVIKNLPDNVLARLKAQAKANHRSLTKEAIVVLSASTGADTSPPSAREPLPPSYRLGRGPLPFDEIEHATHTGPDDAWSAPDGREALRAALVKQADGSYINVLGIEDESFFRTLEGVRSEFRFPDLPDFGDESH
jgi:hypothetical protein